MTAASGVIMMVHFLSLVTTLWNPSTQTAAIDALGLAPAETSELFSVAAALLHLGNLVFTSDASVSNADSKASVKDGTPLRTATTLLRIEHDEFAAAMTSYKARRMHACMQVT